MVVSFDITRNEVEMLYLQLWDISRKHPESNAAMMADEVCRQLESQGINPLEVKRWN